MGLSSNLRKSNNWTVAADGRLLAFAPPDDPIGIRDALDQMINRVSTLENTPAPTVAYVDQLKTRVLALENVPSLSPSIFIMNSRVTALEDKPAPVIPVVSSATPKQVSVDGTPGTGTKFAADDHVHAARVQRKVLVLDASGGAVWTFTKPFTTKPSLQYMVFQVSGQPIIVDATAWTMVGPNYVGVTIRGKRSRPMPTMAPLSITALLTAVTAGVNSIITALSNFDVFGGGNLEGVEVHMSAGDQM